MDFKFQTIATLPPTPTSSVTVKNVAFKNRNMKVAGHLYSPKEKAVGKKCSVIGLGCVGLSFGYSSAVDKQESISHGTMGNAPEWIGSDYTDYVAEDSVSRFVFTFEAIGTQWEIETYEPLGCRLQQCILNRIQQFDITYSRFRPDSLVSRVAASKGGCFDFPDDSLALFTLYDRLHTATTGAVDPLVGRDLELLGYDRTYSLTPVSNLVRAEVYAQGRASWLKDVMRDGTSIVTRRPLVIDVGAVGKGYLVDIVSEILREHGFTRFVIDGSGDMRHAGESSLRVGLEHPFDPRLVIGVANLQDRALCASAVNKRAWGDGLHHVLDARTGIPVQNVVATWVVADDAATADGLATALFFTRADHLAEVFRFSYVRMFADGRAEISQNFDGKLFS